MCMCVCMCVCVRGECWGERDILKDKASNSVGSKHVEVALAHSVSHARARARPHAHPNYKQGKLVIVSLLDGSVCVPLCVFMCVKVCVCVCVFSLISPISSVRQCQS